MEERPERGLVLLLISATAVFAVVSMIMLAQGIMVLLEVRTQSHWVDRSSKSPVRAPGPRRGTWPL